MFSWVISMVFMGWSRSIISWYLISCIFLYIKYLSMKHWNEAVRWAPLHKVLVKKYILLLLFDRYDMRSLLFFFRNSAPTIAIRKGCGLDKENARRLTSPTIPRDADDSPCEEVPRGVGERGGERVWPSANLFHCMKAWVYESSVWE
jgi:hypothetical protein